MSSSGAGTRYSIVGDLERQPFQYSYRQLVRAVGSVREERCVDRAGRASHCPLRSKPPSHCDTGDRRPNAANLARCIESTLGTTHLR